MPPDVTAALGALLQPLDLPAAARWSRGATIHITLVFLGATRPAALPSVRAALREVARAHEPFSVRLGSPGSFGGGGRPRVAWIGLEDGVDELRGLADALVPQVLGPATAPQRPLTPHVTVARRAADDLVPRMAAVLAAAPPVSWTVDRIVLYRSHLRIGPPVHEELAVASLGGNDPP